MKQEWPKFMTVAEVAAILRVSKMTVYRLANDGVIKSTRVGRSFRITEAAVRDYLEQGAGPG
jgi:excisionase family DNA binding protein